jgi:hypothetical protein
MIAEKREAMPVTSLLPAGRKCAIADNGEALNHKEREGRKELSILLRLANFAHFAVEGF